MAVYSPAAGSFSNPTSGTNPHLTELAGSVNSTRDGSFATRHGVEGSQFAPASGFTALWNYNFNGSGLPSTPIVTLKARVGVTAIGTSPSRSGSFAFRIGAATLAFDRPSIVWNTSTGNIATGVTDLYVSQFLSGGVAVPLTGAIILANTINLAFVMNSISSGTAQVNIDIFEVFVEDGVPGDLAFAFYPV